MDTEQARFAEEVRLWYLARNLEFAPNAMFYMTKPDFQSSVFSSCDLSLALLAI